jgi:hypothetical protein
MNRVSYKMEFVPKAAKSFSQASCVVIEKRLDCLFSTSSKLCLLLRLLDEHWPNCTSYLLDRYWSCDHPFTLDDCFEEIIDSIDLIVEAPTSLVLIKIIRQVQMMLEANDRSSLLPSFSNMCRILRILYPSKAYKLFKIIYVV